MDLRNNGGGLLSEAVAIANEFLQKDEIISYTLGYRRQRHDFIADGLGKFKDGKLVHFVERHQIEGNTADMIGDHLKKVFEHYC